MLGGLLNFKSIFVILVIMRKLSQLHLPRLSHFILKFPSIPCEIYAMSILIFTKSNLCLCPHISSSARYHGNLKASNISWGESRREDCLKWKGDMALTLSGASGREIRAAHTSHVLTSWEHHIREQKARKCSREREIADDVLYFICLCFASAVLFFI